MNKEQINGAIRAATGLNRDDFDSDLNASHEMVLTLCDGSGKHEQFSITLMGILACNDEGELTCYDVWKVATATAAQRAEAFLKTLGLWKETP